MKIMVAASQGMSILNFRKDLIKDMIRLGNEVICISVESNEQMESKINEIGAKYVQIPMDRTGTNPFSDLKVIKRFKKVLKKYNPDLFFAYMSKPVAYGGYAARKLKIKKINILINGLENAYYRKDIKSKIIKMILNVFYKYSCKKANNVFFQNNDDMMLFRKLKIVDEKNSIVVNGSGVNMNYFSEEPLPSKFSVLLTARLLKSKGICEYIEAAKIVNEVYPDIEFKIVGNFDSNQESISTEEFDKMIKGTNVKYLGAQSDVRPFLKNCSVFILPSYHEGLPRSILEAMATGRPIITTNVPGCKETVVNKFNGFIVEQYDYIDIAKYVINLYEDREMLETMAKNSYKMCQEKYEVSKVNSEMLKKMNIK